MARSRRRSDSSDDDSSDSDDDSRQGRTSNPFNLPDAEEVDFRDPAFNHDWSSSLLPMTNAQLKGVPIILVDGISREILTDGLYIRCGTCKAVVKATSVASHCTKCKRKKPFTKKKKYAHATGVLQFLEGGRPSSGGGATVSHPHPQLQAAARNTDQVSNWVTRIP